MKKVLIEGNSLFREKSGVGQYLSRLIKHLFEIDKTNHYYIFAFLFAGKKLKPPLKKKYKNVTYQMVRYLPSKVHNQISRKLFVPPADILTAKKYDIALYGNFVRSPLIFGGKTITVIYDLSFLHFRQYSDKKNAKLLTKRVPSAVQKSDIIITISENSKREIIEEYGADDDKIKIISPAIDPTIYKPAKSTEINNILNKYDIAKPYILYTGTLEPRKNIVGILDAYASLTKNMKSDYCLVLAGGKGWLDGEIQQKLKELADCDIITTGYVPDDDLPALYSGASVFVYPSFYEGFGMPPLEAMACGTPVITSNNSSLPEVVGDAGIMIEADDIKALASSIQKVLTNEKLAKEMSKKGLAQAKKFSWEKSAEKLHRIIEELA